MPPIIIIVLTCATSYKPAIMSPNENAPPKGPAQTTTVKCN